jgi:hypothetical protein
MAVVGFVSYIQNTFSVGVLSDIYLVAMVAAASVGLLSLNYMIFAKEGNDDEIDTEVVGLTISKKYYYLVVLAIAVWRGIEGYQMNHHGRGLESTWGIIWLIASIALGGFTWVNYKSLMSRETIISR